MKKVIIASLLIGFTLFSTGANVASATTIYASLPDPKDTYYLHYSDVIEKFNQDLQISASSSDHFTSLTYENADFTTTNFYYPDIWIRDVAPVITSKMVKFKYSPNYLPKSDSKYLNRRFNKFLKRRYRFDKSNLVLDGGNVQWNGGDTIILTKQVLLDNREWSKSEIIDELKDKLSVKHVIIISKEPGDILGHSDGMVKFIAKHKLFINDFSYEPGFRKKVEHEILQECPEIKFIVLPSSYTDKGQYDSKIASARGLYINMLETKDAIYFPQYNLKNDHQAMKIVERYTTKKVIPINISKLSTTGGSIHCLTWEVPSNKFNR
ncbi:agmatine deiminase family protein [Companilactobacillus sp.]|jgi:agmatine/peptidylarginine deiminase|uniref:agmatine deiminase family protein n=1 Tax=Companilactobacillus sp. TaxID=2767905 RepID=UPI0025C2E3A3|nr:agmatine deiminase family protein [Companilactobacillus sp.]MCH4009516.1 agmatine deiminase family protein [Companilactobacillus sp.]MCH4052808.1 agmatine deiminase family protein [Companilactobacillus sp.]MCH4077458.1 agmatine deiminase family protein [Companilactobacillus sp.]MCH4126034.1 agmatine deiminase family protein [Companilactobacillus sp.]MCI1311742.1 agmatine deiminase family protein [Companilactobacillus sp.]